MAPPSRVPPVSAKRRHGLCSVGALLVLAMVSGIADAAQSSDAASLAAKSLLREGTAALQAGRFDDARAKFIAADERKPHDREVSKAFRELDRQIERQVRQYLETAKRWFSSGSHDSARDDLQKAIDISGDPDGLLSYDLGLNYIRQQNSSAAADMLSRALDRMPDGADKTSVQLLLSEVMGRGTSVAVPASLYKQIAEFNQLASQREPYSRPEAERRMSDLCAALESMRSDLPESPALLFNLAKCAEMSARYRDADVLLDRYLLAAPDALDRPVITERRETLSRLSALEGRGDEAVRDSYRRGGAALEGRRFDQAIEAYGAIRGPEYPEAQSRLAAVYVASGMVDEARRALANILQSPDASEEDRQQATLVLGTLATQRAQYDALIEASRRLLGELADAWTRWTVALRQKRLSEVSEQASKAAAIFPHGWEANELLAYAYQQSGNQRLAIRALDAVWANGRPVFFFAAVRTSVEPGAKAASRAEPFLARIDLLQSQALEIVPARGQAPLPPSFDSDNAFGGQPERIAVAQIALAEVTGGGQLRLQLRNGRVVLMQLGNVLTGAGLVSDARWIQLMGGTPTGSGQNRVLPVPLRRLEANKGARLLVRYLGMEGIELGAEHLTPTEKVVMVGWLALNIYNVASTFSNAQNLASQLNNQRVVITNVLDVTTTIRTIQGLARYQRMASEASPFRAMPTAPSRADFKLSW